MRQTTDRPQRFPANFLRSSFANILSTIGGSRTGTREGVTRNLFPIDGYKTAVFFGQQAWDHEMVNS